MHGERIKQGRFGKVWRALHTYPDGSGTIVVIKQVEHDPDLAWQEQHEVECISRLNDHRFRDHIIKLLGVFHQVEKDLVANIIVMESGVCTLRDIQRSTVGHGIATAQAWMRSLARAVWACHEYEIMHRDIKPANCIMCMNAKEHTLELKLADFGNSAIVMAGPPVAGVSLPLAWATTSEYSAPELFRDHHTLRGDVWSIGVICSELLHTRPGACVVWADGDPRTEAGVKKWVAAAEQHCQRLQEIRGNGPPVSGLMGIDFCRGCCQVNVQDRLTAEQAANHTFILSCLLYTSPSPRD